MCPENQNFIYHDITYSPDIPCWYELSWLKNGPALVLKIHQNFIKDAYIMTPQTPLVRALSEDLNLKNFCGDFRGDYGFEGAFKHQGEKDDFTQFSLPIPEVKKVTDDDCRWCGGSGQDNFRDEDCLNCSGTGKDYEMDWQAAYTASASLTVLTTLLKICQVNTSAYFHQLLTVETITQRGDHGGSLGAEVSFPFRSWLTSHTGYNTISKAISAMSTAYDRMVGIRGYDKQRFMIQITENGRLIMDCPGDACGIFQPGYHSLEEGRGYELECHNVDSPVQQLTLVAGLAALHDKARKEIPLIF